MSTLATSNMLTVGTSHIWASMSMPQGRFLHDFFLYKGPPTNERLDPKPEEVGVFVYVDGSMVDELFKTLKR